MSNEYLKAVLKNSVGASGSIREGDGPPSSPSSFCPSSKNSSVGDFEELESLMMGHSPNAPFGGRSVKDFEEQLATLKKENFNLKLRIYFLEEKMGANFVLDKDNILKKHVEFQVEIANMQKELKEKHDLLCQAVKALEIMESEHNKYSQNKEEQLSQLQQEMEELRLQMQDVNSYGEKAAALKSEDSSRQSYVHDFLAEPFRRHAGDDAAGIFLKDRSDNQMMANFVYDRTENLRQQIDGLQQECENRDQTIDGLNKELAAANERLIDFARQVKEYEEKMAAVHLKNRSLLAKLQEEEKNKEKLKAQLSIVNQKYTMFKYEVEREQDELHHEKKCLERDNVMLEMRASSVESENRKQKELLNEQRVKLEAAVAEAKKNQNLAVSTVSHAATLDGAAQTNTLPLSIKLERPKPKIKSPSSKIHMSPLFDTIVRNLERLAKEGAGPDSVFAELGALKDHVTALKQEIVRLEGEKLKACEMIKAMIDGRKKDNREIAELKRMKKELETELENKVSKLQDNEEEQRPRSQCEKCTMEPRRQQQMGALVDVEAAKQDQLIIDQLEKQVTILKQMISVKNEHLNNLQGQYEDILKDLEEKENRIIDLESQLVGNETAALEQGDCCSKEDKRNSGFYKRQLHAQNQEVERLNGELKKCTSYLQEIVNKELWAKNREIEKFHQKQLPNNDLDALRKELASKDLQLKMLKGKISELGLDDKLAGGGEQTCLQLKKRIAELEEELIQKERVREELCRVCSVLGTRLEELAVFLNSLLKQKSMLGFLGLAKNKKLREIVSNSLDLSRSFSTSAMMINPEQSLMQLTNISALLNCSVFQELSVVKDEQEEAEEEPVEDSRLSIVPDHISLTYESCLIRKNPDDDRQRRVIETLREQIIKLKDELQVRDNELNRLHNEGKESGMNSSENESRAKIDKSTPRVLETPHSESETWSEPDRAVSRARIGLNRSVQATYCESTEDDDHLYTPTKKRSALIELSQEVDRLQKEVDEKTEEIIANGVLYRQKLQEMDRQVQESHARLSAAEEGKREVLERLQKIQEQTQLTIEQLEVEKRALLLEYETCRQQLTEAEERVVASKQNTEELEETLRKQYEDNLIGKLKDAEEVFVNRLKVVEQRCEAELRIAQEQCRLEYEQNFVKRAEVEAKLLAVEAVTRQCEQLKMTVQEYQLREDATRLEMVGLKADREKEKALTEEKETELTGKLQEIYQKLAEVSDGYEQQITELQKQKDNLELKISELESGNAELHNRLIKAQTSKFSLGLNSTCPGNLEASKKQFYKRQLSDQAPYYYEDHNRAPDPHDSDHDEDDGNNSSPDLGIESDLGRFSSLETTNNPHHRPLVPAIEITDSLIGMFDNDRGGDCASGACCRRSAEMLQENATLKQKLTRMKRALEETATELNLANQRKKQVEKAICKQIHKTSQVLRKAKANLDSESESGDRK